jgi:hypothetical protein
MVPQAPPMPDSPPMAGQPGNGHFPAAVGDYTASYWKWLSFLFLALWLLTSGLLIWRLREVREQEVASSGEAPDESGILKQLKQACTAGDEKNVRVLLNRWLRDFGPADASGSLIEFASDVDDDSLRQNLLSLDSQGFRPEQDSSWDGHALWTAFSAWRTNWMSGSDAEPAAVTDLYARV